MQSVVKWEGRELRREGEEGKEREEGREKEGERAGEGRSEGREGNRHTEDK